MSRQVVNKYMVYDLEDLKKDNEMSNKIYENWRWHDEGINDWAEDAMEGIKKFAKTLNMRLDYSLSQSEYPDRSDYLKFDTSKYDYVAPGDRNRQIANAIKDLEEEEYYFPLVEHTKKLTKKWHKDYSIEDFAQDLSDFIWKVWFKNNEEYYSKEHFLDLVEMNGYEFTEDGDIFYRGENYE